MLKDISTWLVVSALVLAVLVVFGQVGSYEFVTYDDDIYVTDNPVVKKGLTTEGFKWAFTATTALHWHPVTWLSHMLDWQLFGGNPRGHHLHNLLLHVINSILLFLFLKRETRAVWPSALVAGLFAVHPLHVEAVAWISARKDLLAGLFWLSALTAYCVYARTARKGMYLLAFGVFILGLMSKAITVALPAVLLMFDFWPLQRLGPWRTHPKTATGIHGFGATSGRRVPLTSLVLEKMPFFVAAALAGAVTLLSVGREKAADLAGALPSGFDLAEAMVNSLQYLVKTVWPIGLTIHYPYLGALAPWQIWGSALVLVTVTGAGVWQARRKPYVLVGWLWYLLTLAPVLGLVSFGPQRMADRYTYIPLIGLFMVFAWSLPVLLQKWRCGRLFIKPAAGIALLVFMGCAWQQAGYWKNSIALYERAVAVNKDNYLAYNNLGNALAQKGNIEEALVLYEKTIAIKPDYDKVYDNIGIVLARKGNISQAILFFEKALDLNPANAKAHNNLGFALEQIGDVSRAIEHYRQALQINPQYEKALGNLKAAESSRTRGLP